MEYSTKAGSGVPNVGAPDCIEIDEALLDYMARRKAASPDSNV